MKDPTQLDFEGIDTKGGLVGAPKAKFAGRKRGNLFT